MPNNKIEFKIPSERIIKSKKMEKLYNEMRKAAGRAARAGAMAMQDVILDSPTGTRWHERRNAWRASREPIGGKYRGPVTNEPGSRIETGNMYNLISATRGKIIPGKDRRYSQSIAAAFGWPATKSGEIKDAPSAPIAGSRSPDTPNWRSDPRYIAMQEESMQAGSYGRKVALSVLREELQKLKRKI